MSFPNTDNLRLLYLSGAQCPLGRIREILSGAGLACQVDEPVPDYAGPADLLVAVAEPVPDYAGPADLLLAVADRGAEALERWPSLPAILLLTTAEPQAVAQAMDAGATDTASLADLERELPAAVARALRNGRIRRHLEDAHAKIHGLFDRSVDAILIVDAADGTILEANRNVKRLLGHEPAELVGKPYETLIPPDSKITNGLFLERARMPGPIFEEQEFLRADGDVCCMDLTVRIVTWAGQDAVLAALRDVTERRNYAQENARLATAVEQAAEGIVITGRRGRIAYVNGALETITGYRRTELIGQRFSIFDSGLCPAETRKEFVRALSRGEVWTGRGVHRRKDGEVFHTRIAVSPIRDARGRIMNYVAVGADMTEENRLREHLRQAQKMECLGQLAAGVAHDFNNILTTISGAATFLREDLAVEDMRRGDVIEIMQAADRASRLTRQLLAFSRRQVVAPVRLDLNRIVRSMESMLKRLIGEHIELSASLSPESCMVVADPGQLEQVLMNLAVNARDAMPDGGKLQIATDVRPLADGFRREHLLRDGEYVVLSFSDTGEGIPDDIRGRIFEPFFTTKGPSAGTGMGLSIVFGVLRQTGGSIDVDSTAGEGATFRLYLPRACRNGEDQAIDESGSQEGRETILVVEDEEPVRRTLVRGLRHFGYTVMEAKDGVDALEVAQNFSGHIDLLITDVTMPRMNGRELAERLLRDRRDVQIIYICGYTDDVPLRHGIETGRLNYLQKPFTPGILAARARTVLDALQN